MDETRLRAVIREEISLAMKALEREAYSSDPDSDVSFEQALSYFNSFAYQGACEGSDEKRGAANPFEESEPEGEAATVEVKAFVHAEVQNVLREMRDTFRLSDRQDDLRIAGRLDYLITARDETAEE